VCAISLSIDNNIFTCADIGFNDVTLTVTDNGGNTASCVATVTVDQDALPPTAVCETIDVSLNPSGTATVTAASVGGTSSDNCGVADLSLDVTAFTCDNIGPNTVTLTATDANNNAASCEAIVNVIDNTPPIPICQNITVQLNNTGNVSIANSITAIGGLSYDNCGIANLSLNITEFTCNHVGDNPIILTVTDVNNNSSACNAIVTVQDYVTPTVICQNITVQLGASGSITVPPDNVNNGSYDNCSIGNLSLLPNFFTCNNVGANPVVLTVTDVNGNATLCSAIVTVEDNVAPTMLCQNITIELNETGDAAIVADDIDGGTFDNCGISGLIANPNTFTCDNVGANVVNLTAIDVNNNSATCTANVTVQDNILPVAICQGFTAQLDDTGNVLVPANSVDNGSTDNCGIADLVLTPNIFTCNDVGNNTVNLDVIDVNGNLTSCSAIVVVEDSVAPAMACQNITVQLDDAGNASITPADVDNGSSDACGIVSLTAVPSTFICANVGNNEVTLTAVDVNGNVADCMAIVNLQDDIAPTMLCKDIVVQLDDMGDAIIVADDINDGTFDNCGIAELTALPNTFTCTNVDDNIVTLTATDVNGNSATCEATVVIEDNIEPTMVCQDIVVQLDVTGNASITAADVDGGSSDACGIAGLNVVPNVFVCGDVGNNNVVLTATDIHGNTASCDAIVNLQDNIAPTMVCQDIVVQLDAVGNASITADNVDGGSSDACGVADLSIDNTSFTCDVVGANTVTLTATDVNNNSASCTATVVLEDNVLPTMVCQNITVQLNTTGEASIVPADVDGGSTDNCGIAGLTAAPNVFTCATVGTNTVTLTATDVNNNSANCLATVTIEDNVLPTMVCQDIVVPLDGSGNASITAADVDGGSSDACGIAELTALPNVFTCDAVGANTVTLTATDVNGNSATCTAMVALEDNSAPSMVCQDIIVPLDANGSAVITAADVDGGSTDACGIASLSIDNNAFTCTNVGDNTITLTATDINGNSATCTAVLALQDDTAPIAVCQDITVELNTAGSAVITAADVDGGSNDNCGIADLSLDITTFSCVDMGENIVELSVVDVNGNTSTCSAMVIVIDTEAPVITSCPTDFTVCQPTVIYPQVTFTDNCWATLSFSPNEEAVFAIGTTTVTATVTDNGNNSSICTFDVTYMPLGISLVASDYNGYGISCANGNDGSVMVQINTELTPPYTYSWSNGSTSSVLSNVGAGSYSVTVQNASGCVANGSVYLTQPSVLNCSVIATDITCADADDAMLNASASGGAGSYMYNWTDQAGNVYSGAELTNLPAGDYDLVVSDANNCTCATSTTIEEVLPLSIISQTNNSSEGDGGAVPNYYNVNTLIFEGGTPPYQFDWSNEGYVRYEVEEAEDGSVTITIIYSESSNWSLVVTDKNDCAELSFDNDTNDTPESTLLDIYDYAITPDNGSGNGSINVLVEGGQPCSSGYYNYAWAGPDNWSIPNSTDISSLSGLPSGWYTVTITDCGADDMLNTGDEQMTLGWYWIPTQTRGRGKTELQASISVAPNPVQHEAMVSFVIPTNERATISLTSLNGQTQLKVYDETLMANTQYDVAIQVGQLPKGVYVCQLLTESGLEIVEKVIVY